MKKTILIQIATFLVAIAAHASTIPDNFANAQVLSGYVLTVSNNNTTATLETGEPTATGLQTLWYSWTAPDTGELTINLNGSDNFTQTLTVWMGNSLTTLKAVVSSSAVYPSSTFPVVAGSVYYICTGSYYSGSHGNIQVNLSLNNSSTINTLNFVATATTINDNFANRIVTSTQFGSYVAYNGSATREALEPTPGYNTMWWTYHATATGVLDINDAGDAGWTFTKSISVWNGTAVQNLELLTPSVSGSDCTLPVIAGNDYQICISSYYNGSSGPIVLTFSLNTTTLSSFNLSGGAIFTNDNFNSAAVLTGATPGAIAYNAFATREALEPSGNGNQTIWFKWTAPASGLTQITTAGSDSFTQTVTVFTGTAINALAQVTQAAANPATATFTAIAGQTYYISVGSYYSGNSGSIVFSIFGQPGTTSGPTLSITQAMKLSFATVTNKVYRVQQSTDLQTWNSLTNVINGNNSIQSVFIDPQGAANNSYRVTVQ